MYIKALENLKMTGLMYKHGIVKMFVKPDRYPADDILEKDPRAIQYRSPEFNLEFSRYVKSFEHAIYSTLKMGVCSNTRVIAKGLNNYQRAALIMEKAAHFDDPIFILLDHSRFDSTINVEHLKSTHKKYQRAFHSRTLQKILNFQLVNVGYSKHGIKYRARGTRMSGDADTGCGNSMINADVLWAYFKFSKIRKYDFILDGDDSIGFIERADLSLLNNKLFGYMGFDTKFQIVDNIHQAEFCQSRLVLTTPPVMVRNPVRAFSHGQCCRRSYAPFQYRQWLAAVGECELSLNQGVPLLQSYGQQLADLSTVKLYDEDYRWKMETHEKKSKSIPITQEARVSFYEAWGVPIHLQEIIENIDFTSNVNFSMKSRAWRALKTKNIKTYIQQYVGAVKSISTSQSLYRSLDQSSGSSWWCCS